MVEIAILTSATVANSVASFLRLLLGNQSFGQGAFFPLNQERSLQGATQLAPQHLVDPAFPRTYFKQAKTKLLILEVERLNHHAVGLLSAQPLPRRQLPGGKDRFVGR